MTMTRRQYKYSDPAANLRKQVTRLAEQAAKRRLEELYQTSRLALTNAVNVDDNEEGHNQQQQQPMLLSWDDVFVEDLLGMGSFGSVCLVTCPKLRWQREREQQLCQRRQRQRQRQLTLEEENRQLQQQQDQQNYDLSEEERNAQRNRNLNLAGDAGEEEKEEKDGDNTESEFLGTMQMKILDDNDDSSFVTTGGSIASNTILSSVSHASTTTSGFLGVQQRYHNDDVDHNDDDDPHDDHHDHDDDDDDPHFLDRPNKYFACKSLSQKTIRQANVRGFVAAAADLVHEAFLLKHIAPHLNIVRLHGIHNGYGGDWVEQQRGFRGDNSNNNSDGRIDIEDNTDDDSDLGYFLVMEALTGGILSDKINDWRQLQLHRRIQQQRQKQRRERQQQQGLSLESILTSPDEKQQQQQQSSSLSARRSSNNLLDAYQQLPTLEERLGIAIQIATAIQHLHNHGIVYRDLKPQNVGLSVEASSSAGPSQQEQNPQRLTSLDQSSSPPLHPPHQQHFQNQQHHQQHNQQVSLSWRLFDFGLAREVAPATYGAAAGCSKTLDPPLSVCYGKAGSPRYMAPETMGGKRLRSTTCNGGKTKQHKSKSTIRGATTTTQTHTPGAKDTGNGCCYATFASDVYSFGVVLWELIGLQEFDRRYDSRLEEFESAVCDHRYRPNIQAVEQAIADDFDEYLQNSSSSNEPLTSGPAVAASAAFLCRHRDLRKLVEACWHEDCRQRPCFEFIIAELKEMVPPPVLFFDDTNNPRQHQQQQQQHSVGRRSSRRRSSNSMLMAITDLFENDCMSLDEDDEFDNGNGNDDYEGNEHEDFRHHSFPTNESTTSPLMNQPFVLTIPKQHTHAWVQSQPVAPFSVATTNAGASLLSSSMSGLCSDSNDVGRDELSSSAMLLDSTKKRTSKVPKRSSI